MNWRTVPDFPLYDVSHEGLVRSRALSATGKPKPLKLRRFKSGYVYVCLTNESKHKIFRVHRLVWIAFRGPIPDNLQINHIDGVKTNNALANLELVTAQENSRHAWRIGANKKLLGEANPASRFTNNDVIDMRRRSLSGETFQSIAAHHGTSGSVVCKIVKKGTWKHIGG